MSTFFEMKTKTDLYKCCICITVWVELLLSTLLKEI